MCIVLSELKLFNIFLMMYINQDQYGLKREGWAQQPTYVYKISEFPVTYRSI